MTDLKNYQPKHTEERREWVRAFWNSPHCGFSFPVDQDGNYLGAPRGTAWENYQDCLAGKHPSLIDQGVIENVWYAQIPASGTCRCGRFVWLNDALWNACDCGRYYNLSGQEVQAPHSGPYETGEMLSDIYLGKDEDY